MAGEAEIRIRERLSRLRSLPLLRGARLSGELERLQRQLDRLEEELPSDEEIWRSVELARHEERPYTLDYVTRMFEDFVELHGDRAREDDARDGGGRTARIPARHARGHPRRVPWRRRRAARPGRRHRRLAGEDGATPRPDRDVRHRRGRFGRRRGDRARRPGADAGERDLLGHLARGLRGDPVARRGGGTPGSGGAPA